METYLPINLIKKNRDRSLFLSIRNKHVRRDDEFSIIIRSSTLHISRGKKEELLLFSFSLSCNNHGDSARKLKEDKWREYISLTQFMNQPVTQLERRKSSRGNEIVAGFVGKLDSTTIFNTANPI